MFGLSLKLSKFSSMGDSHRLTLLEQFTTVFFRNIKERAQPHLLTNVSIPRHSFKVSKSEILCRAYAVISVYVKILNLWLSIICNPYAS